MLLLSLTSSYWLRNQSQARGFESPLAVKGSKDRIPDVIDSFRDIWAHKYSSQMGLSHSGKKQSRDCGNLFAGLKAQLVEFKF